MAIKLVDQKWCIFAGDYKKSFVVDSAADVANLPTSCPGSDALVVATGDIYMVNASGTWAKFGE